MKLKSKNPPREFKVGLESSIVVKDCGEVALEADEQLTFVTPSNKNYDVVAKSWGFYATPSLNGRLKNEAFRSALEKNELGRYYIMLVEKEREGEFARYLAEEKNEVVQWLDVLH